MKFLDLRVEASIFGPAESVVPESRVGVDDFHVHPGEEDKGPWPQCEEVAEGEVLVTDGNPAKGNGCVPTNPPPPDSASSDARASELVRVDRSEKATQEDFVANAFDQPQLIHGGRLRTQAASRSGAVPAFNHAQVGNIRRYCCA